jgi:hypothetical protein
MSKQVQLKKHEIPEGWSVEAADFINRVNISSKITLFYSFYKENRQIDLDLEERQK